MTNTYITKSFEFSSNSIPLFQNVNIFDFATAAPGGGAFNNGMAYVYADIIFTTNNNQVGYVHMDQGYLISGGSLRGTGSQAKYATEASNTDPDVTGLNYGFDWAGSNVVLQISYSPSNTPLPTLTIHTVLMEIFVVT